MAGSRRASVCTASGASSGQLERHARTGRVAGDVRPLDADLAHERVAVRGLPGEAHGAFHAAAGSRSRRGGSGGADIPGAPARPRAARRSRRRRPAWISTTGSPAPRNSYESSTPSTCVRSIRRSRARPRYQDRLGPRHPVSRQALTGRLGRQSQVSRTISSTTSSSVSRCSRASVRHVSKLSASAMAARRQRPPPAADAPPAKQNLGRTLPVLVVRRHHRVLAGVGEHVRHHRLRTPVVSVRLHQRRPQALAGIRDRAPPLQVGSGMTLEVLTAAGARERELVGEVAVDGHASHPGALRDLGHRSGRGADRLVQLDCRLDDSLSRLVLSLGAALELVGAGHAIIIIKYSTLKFDKLPARM